MTFYFARHGETDWNVKKKIQGKTDIPLNATGAEQARQLARRISREGISIGRAYTSPQKRAAETARIVAEELSIPCVPLDGLREMDMGEWEGSNWRTIEKDYGEAYQYWKKHRRYTHIPGGESYDEVLGRTFEALERILGDGGSDALVVSHSAVFMALRCYLAGEPFEGMAAPRYKTKNAEYVMVEEEKIRDAIEAYRAGR